MRSKPLCILYYILRAKRQASFKALHMYQPLEIFEKGIMAIFLRWLEDIQSSLNEGKELGETAPPGHSLEC